MVRLKSLNRWYLFIPYEPYVYLPAYEINGTLIVVKKFVANEIKSWLD